jgi:hypothetical protein
MVLPSPFDAQILPGVALLPKTASDQQRTARSVVRQAGGLDPVKAKAIEGEGEDERKRRGHVALP